MLVVVAIVGSILMAVYDIYLRYLLALQKLKMAKIPKYGVSNYYKRTPRKRPGRHKKNRNKHEKRMGKYIPKTGT